MRRLKRGACSYVLTAAELIEPVSAGSIVLLSGPVGAGKTTVAKHLVAASVGPTAYIEGDTFWTFIAKPSKERHASDGFKMIMRAMLASARHYHRDDYEVIVDFSIPPWYFDAVRALLKGIAFDYVVIRPSEAVCAARAAARSEGAIADYAQYRDLYEAFDTAERFSIGNDGSDAATLAKEIRTGINARKFRVP